MTFREGTAIPHKTASDLPFLAGFIIFGSAYVLIILLMLLADLAYIDRGSMLAILNRKEIRFSMMLSLMTSSLSTIFSLWVAVPIGYLMSRFEFRGKSLIEAILDIPIVLPPLVIGMSLLILFNFPPFSWFQQAVVFEVPAIIIAQFVVAAAFAVRAMKIAFDHIPARFEEVAMTLGCNRSQAFWRIILPQARGGLLAAGTIAWARSLGEFGPILIFAGSTRFQTEVLPTSIYLEMQAGNLEGMLAVAMLMMAAAALVLIIARLFGMPRL